MNTPYGRLRVYRDEDGYWWALFASASPKRLICTSEGNRWPTAKEAEADGIRVVKLKAGREGRSLIHRLKTLQEFLDAR